MSAPDPEAPALLRISTNGSIVSEIVNHDGEVLDYQIEPHPEGGISFRRLDGKDGPYRVWKPEGRPWACTCDDAHFRAKKHARYCKHRYFALNLLHLAPVVHALEEQAVAKKKPDEVAAQPGTPTPAAPAGQGQTETERVIAALGAPFDAAEVKWKPKTVQGNRALAMPFVDARVVMDRLDEVLGLLGWQDRYKTLPDGNVRCRLSVRIGGEWIAKEDVGGESGQPDADDRCKAAHSDALKRAAVKFGVGRFLYRQKAQWVDYDPQKKQFVRQPTLQGLPEATATVVVKGRHVAGPAPTAPAPERSRDTAPARSDFYDGLVKLDGTFTEKGLCSQGDFVKAVAAAGKKAGFPASLHEWSAEQIADAREFAKAWEAKKKQEARQPAVA